jgi:hypothetical protein
MYTNPHNQSRMKGRVVEISAESIYLEVEHQIRFRSHYESSALAGALCRDDCIEFHFAWDHGHPLVAIDSIVSHFSMGKHPEAPKS